MTIHGLRGAFITQAQRFGIPIATVAAVVGHESPLTTLRHYTALYRPRFLGHQVEAYAASAAG